ncbi:hypothetical protein HMPREF3212_00974 [Citrobacter freundii]|nr:hypothetical protein HMPREF3212_00974 [Citrobacter freundii]
MTASVKNTRKCSLNLLISAHADDKNVRKRIEFKIHYLKRVKISHAIHKLCQ